MGPCGTPPGSGFFWNLFFCGFSTAAIRPSEAETDPDEGEELPSPADSRSEDESDEVASV